MDMEFTIVGLPDEPTETTATTEPAKEETFLPLTETQITVGGLATAAVIAAGLAWSFRRDWRAIKNRGVDRQ